jgi:hypothetical protein
LIALVHVLRLSFSRFFIAPISVGIVPSSELAPTWQAGDEFERRGRRRKKRSEPNPGFLSYVPRPRELRLNKPISVGIVPFREFMSNGRKVHISVRHHRRLDELGRA